MGQDRTNCQIVVVVVVVVVMGCLFEAHVVTYFLEKIVSRDPTIKRPGLRRAPT